VACGFDLTIGAGLVFPEVNFTLPPIEVNRQNRPAIVEQYEDMAAAILRRAVALETPGIVLEFELLPAMTENPEMGAEITALLHRRLETAHEKSGLRSALRVTPVDIRDRGCLRRSFELCIAAGADIVSIESTGGKDVHDEALMYGNIPAIVHALGVLAPRDMSALWREIVGLCAGTRAVPGGDSACAFANTAMQLAHQKMLPEVLAAVVRAMSAVRSLVAFEEGAVGPSKDCAYEGPVLKALTGCPISMEGKSAACAHFSPIGNIAAAMCDLWSNESVQNVRLLSGSAPAAYTETLVYDCRLMNVAAGRGRAVELRDWLSQSDEELSPQAAVLSPAATLRIARAIAGAESGYGRTAAAGRAAVCEIKDRLARGTLRLRPREHDYLARIEAALESLPADEDSLWREIEPRFGDRFDPESYEAA
ncbi:MAG TPA: methyltransferase MtaB domain-containing protein, partial [Candidatus Acidoferrales bacterium]|nr:methyltransferase MtaB domain-containing protein [Candidatus Acidoferrales bacterium]